jgi:hypothetical protein
VGLGPRTAVVASKRGPGGGGEGIPMAAACEGIKNWEVTQAERLVLNL